MVVVGGGGKGGSTVNINKSRGKMQPLQIPPKLQIEVKKIRGGGLGGGAFGEGAFRGGSVFMYIVHVLRQ